MDSLRDNKQSIGSKSGESNAKNEKNNEQKNSPYQIIKQHRSQLIFFIIGMLAIPTTLHVFKEYREVSESDFKVPSVVLRAVSIITRRASPVMLRTVVNVTVLGIHTVIVLGAVRVITSCP